GIAAIFGEVYLWGTVVEHERGWRAQVAYPKNVLLTPQMIPTCEADADSFLSTLTLYGVDISLFVRKQAVPVWKKCSGYSKDGLVALRAAACGRNNSVPRKPSFPFGSSSSGSSSGSAPPSAFVWVPRGKGPRPMPSRAVSLIG